MLRTSSKRLGIILFAFLAAPGCGGSVTSVEGTVRVKGKPFVGCRVFVFDQNGASHTASTSAEGRYHISEVPVGPVRIAVLPPARPGSVPPTDQKHFANQPPKKFWSAATSDLSTELTEPPNTFDLEIP